MTRDDIIRMAREQGLPETATEGVFIVNTDDLGRMLAAEREGERQRCIEAAWDYILARADVPMADGCADAIRARGE